MRTTIDPMMRGGGLSPRDRRRGYHEFGRAGDACTTLGNSRPGNPIAGNV